MPSHRGVREAVPGPVVAPLVAGDRAGGPGGPERPLGAVLEHVAILADHAGVHRQLVLARAGAGAEEKVGKAGLQNVGHRPYPYLSLEKGRLMEVTAEYWEGCSPRYGVGPVASIKR